MPKPETGKLPENIEDMSPEECAKMLHKALAISKFESIRELAVAIGMPRQTLNHYFFARRKPPQEKWLRLREAFGPTQQMSTVSDKPKVERPDEKGANTAAERLRAELLLLKGDLEFFRDAGSNAREILKNLVSGKQAGYISGLLTALYDEDQLEAWITFSEDSQEEHK